MESLIKGAVEAGYTYFISGFAEGVDLMAAEIVTNLKRDGFPLQLEAAIPGKNQADSWNDRSKCLYALLIEGCDRVVAADETINKYSFLKRDRYMVDESDLVIAVYDGKKGGTGYTVGYARDKKRSLWILDPYECTFTREEGLFS